LTNRLYLAVVLLCLVMTSEAKMRDPFGPQEVSNDVDYLWFDQKVDHFDLQNHDTFKQRYWVNDQWWSAENGGGPLFLYLCGEWTCSNQPETGYIAHLAKEHGAMLVVHEHRYYGMSQPAEDWSTENLKFLNTDQALADIALFASTFAEELAKKHNIPAKRWLLFGGSYPGALVSWFRNKYPHIALGSWSSSGVVNAIEDFYQFDEVVHYALDKNGDQCAEAVEDLVQYTNDEFEAGRGDAIKAVWNAPDMRDDEFHWFYSDVIAETIQYGGRSELCQRVHDLNKDYEAINKMIYEWQVGARMGRDDYWSVSLQEEKIDFSKNGRQWTYQYCNQFGYLQTPAKNTEPLKNKGLDMNFWIDYCSRIFGRPTSPKSTHWNIRYGGANPAISKVIYMNGDEDPWKPSSILETKNPFIHTFPNLCDNCAHCVDLQKPVDTDDKEILKNRKKAEKIVTRWLKLEKKIESMDVPISDREAMTLKNIMK